MNNSRKKRVLSCFLAMLIALSIPAVAFAYSEEGYVLDEDVVVLPEEYFVPVAVYDGDVYIGTIMRIPFEESAETEARVVPSIHFSVFVIGGQTARAATLPPVRARESTTISWNVTGHPTIHARKGLLAPGLGDSIAVDFGFASQGSVLWTSLFGGIYHFAIENRLSTWSEFRGSITGSGPSWW